MVALLQPVQLYRRWRTAAGPDFGMYVPAAPFSELGSIRRLQPADAAQPYAEEPSAIIAASLASSETGQYVLAGKAAFIIDLPGYLSAGVGAYLQTEGIAPVLLMAGFYQPGSFLEGWPVLPNLAYYAGHLGTYSGEKGYAFLLERERLPEDEGGKYEVLERFDNRYGLSEVFFPPFEMMQQKGIEALVDVRATGSEITPDLGYFYEEAALANISVFSSRLELDEFGRGLA